MTRPCIVHYPEMTDDELLFCARANVEAMHPAGNLTQLIDHLANRLEAIMADDRWAQLVSSETTR